MAKLSRTYRKIAGVGASRLLFMGALSTRLWRVSSGVLASEGSIKVWTRNQCFTLKPQMNGTTLVESESADFPVGSEHRPR
jgi:hypothetical protein